MLASIFALILIRHLQKRTILSGPDDQWVSYFKAGIFFSIAFIGFSVIFKSIFVGLLTHCFLLGLLLAVYLIPKLQIGRPMMFSIIPVAAASFIADIVKWVTPTFYAANDDAFESAILFGVIWFIAMWFINRKQHKALENERYRREIEEERTRMITKLKVDLEAKVAQRTNELLQQKNELQQALNELKSTQDQLIHAEKMASLGELTAGIAHEIQNPLNFVNNFSEVSIELLNEMKEGPLLELPEEAKEEVEEIVSDLSQNLEKIVVHGKRADSIVKGMLQHSRSSTGQKEVTDINALAEEYLRLSYHGLRAKDKSFNATIETHFEPNLYKVHVVAQDIGRVLLNLFNNAFYAVNEKSKVQTGTYAPKVEVTTKNTELTGNQKGIEIIITDNGSGIPQRVLDKIYQPFFTTKPAGQGTGLGLSISYDIIKKGHSGDLKIDTKEGAYASFILTIPT
ncbi:histidine kinase [Olivibacter sp. SDN3]|uniref:sensor histidine kinase n=1 Tax=Olivibacter sp. SDN3 TaxID=2764720 RepID=UPI001651563C|nr:ATP-binding protein [Olivibacter sp. SDN3]QNL52327.1 histidine kinase [Olivibacter sp. SDN3]